MQSDELKPEIGKEMQASIEGEVRLDLLTRTLYSTDASIYEIAPLAVALPRTIDDLATIVRIANDSATPLIARGAGSGLAGESLGRAIVVDCSRHLRGIGEIDLERDCVRVEPGVVVDELNARLRASGRMFGPDPGSASRATIGGVVANNSAGMHSLIHGTARDNVLALDLVLSDGSRLSVGPEAPSAPEGTLGARIEAGLRAILTENADLIEEKTPRHLKRHRAGYMLHDVLAEGRLDLSKVICGSEGTLAVIASATLRLAAPPRETGVGLFCFRTVAEAADAVPRILEHGPASIEMLDELILRMAREAGRLDESLVASDTRSVLLVEFENESTDAVGAALEKLERDLRANSRVMPDVVLAREPADRARIWAVRSSSQPLLNRRPGSRQPITLIEDVAVHPDRLGDYIRAIDRIVGKHGLEYAAFGHAGVGLLHTRPFVDLRNAEDVRRARACAEEVYDAALALGGTISGEHGDGLTRTQFLPKQYGALYPVLGEVKRLFDPKEILNPGKIWRAEPRDTLFENLRQRSDVPYKTTETELEWAPGELGALLDRCNGCGECRSCEGKLVMCPSYKAETDEQASPRAKANLMRGLLDGRLDQELFADPEAKRIMDYCINCKGCEMECPLSIAVPKMMLEAKARYVRRRGQSAANRAMVYSDVSARLGALSAPLANAALRLAPVRRLMQSAMGLAAQRPLPPFTFAPLGRFRAACPHPPKPKARVAVFLDLYARYNDPSLTFDFLRILRAWGVEAVVPDQKASGLPALTYASIDLGRRTVEANARSFSRYIDAGYTVVSTEPSAALALREEALLVSSDPLVKKLAENTLDAMTFLHRLSEEAPELLDDLKPVAMRVGYHAPCHVKALGTARGATLALMARVPQLEMEVIEKGCCGIAGTWGMKAGNYERSMRMGAALCSALGASHIERGLSECSTCRMQMEHGSGKSAVHPIAILARAVAAQN